MKTMLFLLVCWALMGAAWGEEVMFSQDFSSGLPPGWSVEGAQVWTISSTNNAGRDVPELLCWADGSENLTRFVSPAYNTSGCNELRFLFWNGMLNPGMENYILKVQVSPDLVNWSTLWNLSGSAEFTGQYVSFSIPRAYLDTPTFHIAFVVEGYLSIAWFIDNAQLNIVSRISTGTWTAAAGPYYLYCDYVVPSGGELVIEPGVQVIGSSNCGLYIYGDIVAEGTDTDPIVFTSDGSSGGWKGLNLQNTGADEIRFSHCVFENCDKCMGGIGGALNIETGWADIYVEFCRFSNNYARDAGALCIQGGWHTNISNCLFEGNYSSGSSSTLYLDVNEYCYLSGNAFENNNFLALEDPSLAHVVITARNTFAYLGMNSLTFAHNYGGDAALLLRGDPLNTFNFSNVYCYNSIFWNPYLSHELAFSDAFQGGRTAGFYYCDIDPAKVYGSTPVYAGSINSDPIFISMEDCHLLGNSPCVNTGQQGASDPDGTRKDMGAYPIFARPVIAAVNDVPWDQGRQVEVFWNRSGMDNVFLLDSFYSVWRGDAYRGSGGTVIATPSELPNLSSLENVWWLDRNVAWQYMGQCPAYNFDDYAWICPTLHDSCSTGSNPAPFRVVYQWNSGFCASTDVSGYSVDNIPPDTVRDLAISMEPGQLRLEWSPVTSGTLNGSSYPELNGVYYMVYAGDEPYFVPGPDTLLGITSQTFRIEEHLTWDRRFFRIVTIDQLP